MRLRKQCKRAVAWVLTAAVLVTGFNPGINVYAEEPDATSEEVVATQEATTSEEVTSEEVKTETSSEATEVSTEKTESATSEEATKETSTEEKTEVATTEKATEEKSSESTEEATEEDTESTNMGKVAFSISEGGQVTVTIKGTKTTIEKRDGKYVSVKDDKVVKDLSNQIDDSKNLVFEEEIGTEVKVKVEPENGYEIGLYSELIDGGETKKVTSFKDDSYETSIKITNKDVFVKTIFLKSNSDDSLDIDELYYGDGGFIYTSVYFKGWGSGSLKSGKSSISDVVKSWASTAATDKSKNSIQKAYNEVASKDVSKGAVTGTWHESNEGDATISGSLHSGSASFSFTSGVLKGFTATGCTCCSSGASDSVSGMAYVYKCSTRATKKTNGHVKLEFRLEVVPKAAGNRTSVTNHSVALRGGLPSGYQAWRRKVNIETDRVDVRVSAVVNKDISNVDADYIDLPSLAGGEFNIYVDDVFQGKYTTDSSGHIETGEFALDPAKSHKFTAEEITPPPGLVLNANNKYTVTKAANTLDDGDCIPLGLNGTEQVLNEAPKAPLSFSLVKRDSITKKPVAGAQYHMSYAITNGITIEKDIVLDSNGSVSVDVGALFGTPRNQVYTGTLNIQEVGEPSGKYTVDPTVYTSSITVTNGVATWSGWSGGQMTNAGNNLMIHEEKPKRGYASIQKFGFDTQRAEPLKGYSFDGVQFSVYAAESIDYAENATWAADQYTGYTLTCNAMGKAPWVDTTNLQNMLPIGKYYFKETRGNAYYRNDNPDRQYPFEITKDNLTPDTINATDGHGNSTQRADINFKKYRSWRDMKYSRPLENIPFLITWSHDGVSESHIAVTNKDGVFDSSVWGDGDNLNDAVIGKGLTKDTLINSSELHSNGSIYFGQTQAGETVQRGYKIEGDKGSIPVGMSGVTGVITIQELWCTNNANYDSLYSCQVTVGPNGDLKPGEYANYAVPGSDWTDVMPENPYQNTIRDNPVYPVIKSYAIAEGSGTKQVPLNDEETESVVIKDTIKLSSLEIGHNYEVQGRLVDAKTGEAVKYNGEEVTQKLTLTADATETEQVMDYTFDQREYTGKTLVVLAKVYDLSEAEYWGTDPYGDDFMMTEEADLDNEDQTVFVPGIETDAYDYVSEDHQIVASIKDLVDGRKENNSKDATNPSERVVPKTTEATDESEDKKDESEDKKDETASGDSTQVVGQITKSGVDSSVTSGDASGDGKEDTASGDASGDAKKDETKVEPKTWVSDLEAEEGDFDNKDITFSVHDKVTMYNFIPGVEYYYKGTLYQKVSGSEDRKVKTVGDDWDVVYTAENQEKDEFVVDFEKVEMKNFNLNEGAEFYITEEVYFKDADGNMVRLAEHKDKDDERQKLYFTGLFSAFNSSLDTANANHQSSVTENGATTTLSDALILKNLCEGYTYKLTNEARYTDSGEVVTINGVPLSTTRDITVTKEIVAQSKTEDGYKEVFDYTVDTLSLKGKTIVFGEYLSYKGNEINVHNRTNDAKEQTRFPDVKTTAQDVTTATSLAALDSTTLKDTVELSNLQANTTFKIKGILMDKATGEYLGKDLGLSAIECTTEPFTTAKDDSQRKMTKELQFAIPNSLIFKGKQTVIYEELYTVSGDKETLVGYHKDINDLDQTVNFPDEKTTANWDNGTKLVNAENKTFELVDKVHYTGLIPGKEYTQTGTVINQKTGQPLVQNGANVTSSVTFTPETADGDVEIKFTINTEALAGETFVVFEDLYYNGIKIATHSDLEDKDQTVYVPKIGTKATSKDGKKKLSVGEKVTLVDIVEYENLTVGEKYELRGTVVKKGKHGKYKVIKEGTSKFKAEEGGLTEISFKIDTTKLEGEDLVVFEEVYDSQGNLVAMHKDIDDKGQTVSVEVVPRVPRAADIPIVFLGAFLLASGLMMFKRNKKKKITVK